MTNTITVEKCKEYVKKHFGAKLPARLAQCQLFSMVVNAEEAAHSWHFEDDLRAIGYDDEFIEIYSFVRDNRRLFVV